MKIVIAEDDEIARIVLRRTLETLNFEVVAFDDGLQAWEYLRNHEAQVVITDWMMPKLDGLELCQKIRARGPMGPYTYVIMLTSRESRDDRLKALQAGADDLLTKPLDRAELFARVNVARRIVGVAEQLRNRSSELERLHAELEQRNVQLAEIAASDGLTGLKNHRHFLQLLEGHHLISLRRGMPLSVIMIDVDQFKSFNDTFGHPAGDGVLIEVARLLHSSVRDQDLVARYGGEEFAILLPNSDVGSSQALAERLRLTIERHDWPLRPITISLGVSTMVTRVVRPNVLIEQADQSLYQSKAGGRNRVTHSRNILAVSEVAGTPISIRMDSPDPDSMPDEVLPFLA